MGQWSLSSFAYQSAGVPIVPALIEDTMDWLGGRESKALSITEVLFVAIFICVCVSKSTSNMESKMFFQIMS